MTEYVGIVRDKQNLTKAKELIFQHKKMLQNMKNESIADIELQNMVLLAELIIAGALEREESRGAHYRADFPNIDDEGWKKNIIRRRK